MQKLYRLLSTFSPLELARFHKYLASPYLNSDPRLEKLLSFLFPQHILVRKSREALFAYLFPDLPFDYHRISNLISQLNAHIQRFWLLESQTKMGMEQQIHLMTVLRERGLAKDYEQLRNKVEKQPLFFEMAHEQSYYLSQAFEVEKDVFRIALGERRQTDHLQKQLDALEKYFMLSALKTLCKLVNRQRIVQVEGSSPQVQRMLDYVQVQRPFFEEEVPIHLYGLVLQMLLHPTEIHYYSTFKHTLEAHRTQLPFVEQKTLYQYARNYCIQMSNRGEAAFLRELFQLYQIMVEEKLIFYQGYIVHTDVKNMVSLGIRLGEYKWTQAFLDQIADQITPAYRRDAIHFNGAQLAYAQGKFRRALQQLREVNLDESFYHLGAKTLWLKVYFDQRDGDAFFAHVHSFQTWLRRNKTISIPQREGHLAWISLTIRLFELHQVGHLSTSREQIQHDLTKIQEDLMRFQPLSQKGWLEEKVAEIQS
ncbi:MAG: hypothetical protein AAFU33_22415 [Bacteroidota bacterium]